MLKQWHEARPFTFGIIFLVVFFGIQMFDSKYIYPSMIPKCNGEITDQQVRACSDWIHKKETNHVRTNQRGSGKLYRDTPSDEYLREQKRAIDDFSGTQNK